jgi:ATP-dependent DNA ligase
MKQPRFVIDGEICVLDVQGISDFNALHSNRLNDEAQLYAFDLVAIDGNDLRDAPLFERKAKLTKLLRGRPEGIFIAPHEAGEIGPGLFEAARRMDLEGLVSKHAGAPLPAAHLRLDKWQHPAFSRVLDQF